MNAAAVHAPFPWQLIVELHPNCALMFWHAPFAHSRTVLDASFWRDAPEHEEVPVQLNAMPTSRKRSDAVLLVHCKLLQDNGPEHAMDPPLFVGVVKLKRAPFEHD